MAHLAARSLTTKCIAKKNLGKLIRTIPDRQPHRHCQTYFSCERWMFGYENQPQEMAVSKSWVYRVPDANLQVLKLQPATQVSRILGPGGVGSKVYSSQGPSKIAQLSQLLFTVKLQRGLNELVRFQKKYSKTI